VAYKIKYLLTVKRIPDALWNEAKLLILPLENQIIPSDVQQQQYHLGRYSMALYMFWNVLRTGVDVNGR
jgi:hypothetical protein